MTEQPDFVASCDKCGEDFVFRTSRERIDWYRMHPKDHRGFVSFFRQGRL